jgi:hypothetical protein
VAAEQPFGLAGAGSGGEAADPVALPLGDGRVERLAGRVDRLDRTAGGGVVVTDYKTGGASSHTDLGPGQPLGDGPRLQLAAYGLVPDAPAGAVRSEYWFVSARGEFKRIGFPVTDEVVDALRHAVEVAVAGIEGGRFPQRPPEPGWRPVTPCVYCDPDELGTTDRHRAWQRLRSADELAAYVALVEPDALATGGGG